MTKIITSSEVILLQAMQRVDTVKFGHDNTENQTGKVVTLALAPHDNLMTFIYLEMTIDLTFIKDQHLFKV